MATYNYLDKTGLGQVWGKIKNYVDTATSSITTNLSGLTDTAISSPTNGQALLYDSTSSKWVNGTIDTNNLFTITVTSTTENEETIYNANKTFAEIVEAYNVGKILICNGTPLYTARISNPISINDQLIFARSDNASASENENVYILDPIVNYETDPRQVVETEAPIVTVIPRILTWSLTGETYQTNLTANQLKTIYEIFGEIKTGNSPHSVISYMSEYTGSTVHSIISFCTYGRMFLLERYNREDGNEWIQTNMSSPINEVYITDNNTATVLTSDKGFTDILNLQFSGNSIIAYVNCTTVTSGQYQLISTISEHDFDTGTTTGKAVFSNGKEKIYVTDSQYSSTAPSDIAGKYNCSFVHIGIPNDIYSPLDGQILTYDDTNSVWVNSDLPSIPTASSTTPSADGTGAVGTSTTYARADHVHPKITQALSISSNVITLTGSDGTTSSVTIPTSGGTSGASSLSELNDTTITSPSDGQILRYDNSSSKWINSNETTYTFDGTYNASTNKAATVSTVTDAIGALTIPTKTSDLTNDSGFMTGMTILSYGHSTWADFIDVYTNKRVVYCRASSNANPATGSQTRLAFMAYVNNADNPTEVEFQYYRSVNGHSNNQQGDQVYVYKLTKASGWSVTVRECYTKVVAGTGLSGNWASGAITLSLDSTKTATTSANGLMSSTDKSRLDTLYADYSSALTALGVN